MNRYNHYIFDWGNTLMVDFPSENGPMYSWPKVEAIPGSRTLLRELNKFSECSIATNAKDSTDTDIRRALARVNLNNHVQNIFCYQTTGYKKPSKEFFQKAHSLLKIDKNKIVVIGDNLEQDVLWALNFSFDAIWFNADKKMFSKASNP